MEPFNFPRFVVDLGQFVHITTNERARRHAIGLKKVLDEQ